MTRKSSVQIEHVSSDESEGNLHLKGGLTPSKKIANPCADGLVL